MVENRRWLTILSHAVLLLGIAVLAFPIYVTFVASTAEMRDIIQPPLPLVPGPYLIDNYSEALQRGVAQASGAPVALMLWNSLVMALRSEEHTSELQSLMRISYAVFCLKKKTTKKH